MVFAWPLPAALNLFFVSELPAGTKKMDKPWEKREIAKRFKALRRKARISQSLLGELIDICRQSISEIENAHTMPHATTWSRFCELENRHKQPPIRMPSNWR